MSNQLERGIKALLSGPPTAKSLNGGVVQHLTLDNPQGWLTGDAVSLSTDRAMKISTVSSCVEVRSNSVAVLPAYIMNEQTKERLKNHRLCCLLWVNVNEAMTRFDYEKLMECNKLLKGNAYVWMEGGKLRWTSSTTSRCGLLRSSALLPACGAGWAGW